MKWNEVKINLLIEQIKEEIIRLSHVPNLNLEQEQKRFRIYEQLTKEILETHV